MAKQGRPTKRSPELASLICQRIMEADRSLRQICREDEDMPSRTFIYHWLAEDKDFSDQYTRAMEIRADEMFDEIVEIADNASNDWMKRSGDKNEGWELNGEHLNRSRLRIDARKWKLSKMLPKKYGDKLDLNHGGKVTVTTSERSAKF